MGMPLDAFTNEAYEGLSAGQEEVLAGNAKDWYQSFEPQRQETFHKLAAAMSGGK